MNKKYVIILAPFYPSETQNTIEIIKHLALCLKLIKGYIKDSYSFWSLVKPTVQFKILNLSDYSLVTIENCDSEDIFSKLKYTNIDNNFYPIDINAILNIANKIKSDDKLDQLFFFSVTPSIIIYRNLKLYDYFEKLEIVYRNIDFTPGAFLSKAPDTVAVEKKFFYNININSDKYKFNLLFNKNDYWFRSKFSKVYLGAACPSTIIEDQEFVIYFSAYIDKYRSEIERIIKHETTKSPVKADLERTNWKKGANVLVKCSAIGLNILESDQHFEWNGQYHILKFDARLKNSTELNRILVKIDVFLEDILIVRLRPEIGIELNATSQSFRSKQLISTKVCPESAYASYSSKDRVEVISKVSAIESMYGIDVFVDCLSIKNGSNWKQIVDREIDLREVFCLFWSRNASKSQEVEYEWRKALDLKTIEGIRAIPLESPNIAPTPAELSELHFGGLKEDWIDFQRKKL